MTTFLAGAVGFAATVSVAVGGYVEWEVRRGGDVYRPSWPWFVVGGGLTVVSAGLVIA